MLCSIDCLRRRSEPWVYGRARARPGPSLRSGPSGACSGLDPPSARPELGIYRSDRETEPGQEEAMNRKSRVHSTSRLGRLRRVPEAAGLGKRMLQRQRTTEEEDDIYAGAVDKIRCWISASA
jgi:hypothetical protein